MSSNPDFILTPQQQELLFAALSASRPNATGNNLTAPPAPIDNPVATKPLDFGFDNPSYLDYDYSFDGDTSLLSNLEATQLELVEDADDGKTDSPPSNDDATESPDKRGHPDDDDDEVAASKRRESGEKMPKKPGRKPLTNEPTSKRKAQNRAAQRAFRERKEKHLKDLEDKVAELQKASDTANTENGLLRSQIDKMTVELNEYKKRMGALSKPFANNVNQTAISSKVFGAPLISNIDDVNFQFEFPKFGELPGPSSSSSASLKKTSSSPAYSGLGTAPTTAANSPTAVFSGAMKASTSARDDGSKNNAYTPPLSNGATPNHNVRGGSTDAGSARSPSTSHSNTAPSSSCGTSPESYSQSPMGFKPVDTLTTIGEEQPIFNNLGATASDFSQFGNVDLNDMSWLDNQSSFNFNPQLFGDYREPQENILANGLDESFFNDALDIDFTTPFNTALAPIGANHKGTSLIDQIDAAKDAEFASSSLQSPISIQMPPAVPGAGAGNLLTCNKIWERLQNCPKVQNGDFDLDGLCSDLQKKAKCSGSGAVVAESDFKDVMTKYLDKNNESGCGPEFISSLTSPSKE